ncbi:MAG: hypothetical protein AAGF13_00965 [Pseudomonadota bacterium]
MTKNIEGDPPKSKANGSSKDEKKPAASAKPDDAQEDAAEEAHEHTGTNGAAQDADGETIIEDINGSIESADKNLWFEVESGLHASARTKAYLLYDHCTSIGANVPESTHNLYIVGEHYVRPRPSKIEKPELINGIPLFFAALSKAEKSEYCYRQVIEQLSKEAWPVTVNSLLATRRKVPSEADSSAAGKFVERVTWLVAVSLVVIAALYVFYLYGDRILPEWAKIENGQKVVQTVSWVAFGCVGALVHLLNHALTTTRLKTFERSEERKMYPRLLLGGMFGFLVPWLIDGAFTSGALTDPNEQNLVVGTIAAFFGGYSVRFSTGLVERILSAIMPETQRSKY